MASRADCQKKKENLTACMAELQTRIGRVCLKKREVLDQSGQQCQQIQSDDLNPHVRAG